MIYVFLDMDGVVLPYHPPISKDSNVKLTGPGGEKFYAIWPQCVEVLNEIGSLYPCKFILNSTWKTFGNRAQVELQKNGFRYNIDDCTSEESGEYPRSHAVSSWFKGVNIDEDGVHWVAIDDEFFSYTPKHRSRNLLYCNKYTGLFPGSAQCFQKLIDEQVEKFTNALDNQ